MLISLATCWEIAIKAGLKKLNLGEPATTFLPRELSTNGFDLLEIEADPRFRHRRCRQPSHQLSLHSGYDQLLRTSGQVTPHGIESVRERLTLGGLSPRRVQGPRLGQAAPGHFTV